MEAARWSSQIGFTILSLTVSLHCRVDSATFSWATLVGRLFREFAVTLAVTIIISAVVSLTLTPMMSARILPHRPQEQQGRIYKLTERAFAGMIAFYGRTLKTVLRFQTITLLVATATLLLTVFLCMVHAKGLLSVQDTGVLQGMTQAPHTIGSRPWQESNWSWQRQLDDPAVESISSFSAPMVRDTTTNSGRMSINSSRSISARSAPLTSSQAELQSEPGSGNPVVRRTGAEHYGG